LYDFFLSERIGSGFDIIILFIFHFGIVNVADCHTLKSLTNFISSQGFGAERKIRQAGVID
jgi:hypothetical protein